MKIMLSAPAEARILCAVGCQVTRSERFSCIESLTTWIQISNYKSDWNVPHREVAHRVPRLWSSKFWHCSLPMLRRWYCRWMGTYENIVEISKNSPQNFKYQVQREWEKHRNQDEIKVNDNGKIKMTYSLLKSRKSLHTTLLYHSETCSINRK